MKKYLRYGVLALTTLVLIACSSQKEEPKSTNKATTTKKTKSEEDILMEQYGTVLEDYYKILDFIQTGSGAQSPDGMRELMEGLNNDLSPWTIQGIHFAPERLRYAFHDLDNNGQKELFIASMPDDGNAYVTAFYYMNGENPTLLGESLAGGTGGARADLRFYGDGTILNLMWSSGTGEGTGVLYQLQADNSPAKEVQHQAISLSEADPASLFGKTTDNLLDVKALEWKLFDGKAPKTSTPSDKAKSMKIEAILKQDFASLAGTWRNREGKTVTIDASGKVIYEAYPDIPHFVDVTGARIEAGLLHAGITNPEARNSATVATQFIPAGVEIRDVAEDASDPTDQSKDRFFSTQYLMPAAELEQAVYYRVEE